MKRTAYCGALTQADMGRRITVMGWVANKRDMGGVIFLDLRDREGEKTTLRDIEEYFGVSHPTVTGILRRMEAKGLVTGCTDGEDRRCRVIRLVHSEPLEAVLQQMPPDRLEPMLTRGLGEQEIEQLRRSLITVLHNVQNR